MGTTICHTLPSAGQAGVKPTALPVRPDGIPTELRELPQWVCWRFAPRKDKWTKEPVIAGTALKASSTNPKTWRRFCEALAAYWAGKGAGVGFVFSRDDPYCGVDLDDCRDPGTGAIAAWALAIIHDLDGYAEVSPSGTGVKIVVRAKLPGAGCRRQFGGGEVEMYDCSRYFALTGHVLEGGGRQ